MKTDPNELDVAVMTVDDLRSMLIAGYTWKQVMQALRLAGRIRPDLCREYASGMWSCERGWITRYKRLGFRFSKSTCIGWKP